MNTLIFAVLFAACASAQNADKPAVSPSTSSVQAAITADKGPSRPASAETSASSATAAGMAVSTAPANTAPEAAMSTAAAQVALSTTTAQATAPAQQAQTTVPPAAPRVIPTSASMISVKTAPPRAETPSAPPPPERRAAAPQLEDIGSPLRQPKTAPAEIPAVKPAQWHEMPDTALPDETPFTLALSVSAGDTKSVPEGWSGDGVVTTTDLQDELDEMASAGDIIAMRLSSGGVKPGDFITVYHPAADFKGEDGRTGAVTRIAIAKAVSVKGDEVTAEIVSATGAVVKGDIISKAEGGL
ncbi:MAG: hypothetical protein WC421_09725 [Elusimicrobiales bacterium]